MTKTLRVGLVGYKFMGKAHSNAWRQVSRFFPDLPAEVEMATLCGRDAVAAERAGKTLGWQRVETDWRKMVSDPNIDIVDICTANDTHAEIAIAAAKAGKAILCEKPLARNVRCCEEGEGCEYGLSQLPPNSGRGFGEADDRSR